MLVIDVAGGEEREHEESQWHLPDEHQKLCRQRRILDHRPQEGERREMSNYMMSYSPLCVRK